MPVLSGCSQRSTFSVPFSSHGVAPTAFARDSGAARFADKSCRETPRSSVLHFGVRIGMGNGDTKTFVLARNSFLQRPRVVGDYKFLCSLLRWHLDAVAYKTKSRSLSIVRIVEKTRPRYRRRSLSRSYLQHCDTCFACRKNSHPCAELEDLLFSCLLPTLLH